MASGRALFINNNTVWVASGTGAFQLQLRADPGYTLFGPIASRFPDYFHTFGSKLLFFETEFGSFGQPEKIQIYSTDGSSAGTSHVSVALTNGVSANLASSIGSGDFAQFGHKMLILDNVVSMQGRSPTVEFLVTNLTKPGTTTFTIPGPELPFQFDAGNFTDLGNLVLFTASNHVGINTLWASNGTRAGTKPLAVKGAASTGLRAADLTVFGQKVLFSGADSSGDTGLWITNGTPAGTRELRQTATPNGFAESLNPQDITVVGGKAFFAAAGELWVTNGTASGTKPLVVAGGEQGGIFISPSEIVRFGAKALVLGNGTTTDLFISDGTSAGSHGINWTGRNPTEFTALGNKMLFEAFDSAFHTRLWVTDGTSKGTHPIKVSGGFSLGLNPSDLTSIGNKIVFSGEDKLEQQGLWVTDGTTAGTHKIKAPLSITDLTGLPAVKAARLLAAATDAAVPAPHHAAAAGDAAASGAAAKPPKAVFAGFDAKGHFDLWVTDGTSGGTIELEPHGADPKGLLDSGNVADPDFTVLHGKVVFAGADRFEEPGLWVTDGTSAGTRQLTPTFGSPGFLPISFNSPEFTVLGGRALFAGQDDDADTDLWLTDGTKAGTRQLTNSGALDLVTNHDFTVLGNKALFIGGIEDALATLWVTDGSAAGTHEIPLPEGNIKPSFTVIGNKAVFADPTNFGSGLYVSDGTTSGTHQLKVSGTDPDFGLFEYFVDVTPNFTVLGRNMLFAGVDAKNRVNLWLTDGTSAGTRELPVAGAGADGLFFHSTSFSTGVLTVPDFTVLGSKAVFEARDKAGHVGLWVTNGTSKGTTELKPAHASAGGLFAGVADPDFTVLGNKVLFAGADTHDRVELWVSDGTAVGTIELLPKGAFFDGLRPSDITVLGTDALFQGDDARGNAVLWVTDGTAAGTHELAPKDASRGGLAPTDITAIVTAPPFGLALAPHSDSRPKGDGVTGVTKPIVTGFGEARDTVKLFDNGKTIGTGKVSALGRWSITPTSALKPGQHVLRANETSVLGSSVRSTAFDVTIEKSAASTFTGALSHHSPTSAGDVFFVA